MIVWLGSWGPVVAGSVLTAAILVVEHIRSVRRRADIDKFFPS